MSVMNSHRRGYAKGIAVMAATLVAAVLGHQAGAIAGVSPAILEGAAGGAVLGAFLHRQYQNIQNASPLVDADASNVVWYDETRRAKITAPPYGAREFDVFAVASNPGGDYPFKVWVDDDGREKHPYYATAIEFTDIE